MKEPFIYPELRPLNDPDDGWIFAEGILSEAKAVEHVARQALFVAGEAANDARPLNSDWLHGVLRRFLKPEAERHAGSFRAGLVAGLLIAEADAAKVLARKPRARRVGKKKNRWDLAEPIWLRLREDGEKKVSAGIVWDLLPKEVRCAKRTFAADWSKFVARWKRRATAKTAQGNR